MNPNPQSTLDRPLTWYAILTLVMFGWSSNHLVFKILLVDLSPATVFLYRYLFASLLLAGLFFWKQRSHPQIQPRDWWWLLGGMVFGTILGGGALLYGIQLSGASVAAILINTNPLFVAVLAFFIGMERVSLVKLIGLLIGLLGVVAVVMGGSSVELATGTNQQLGMLITIAGSICIAIATLISKHLIPRVSGLVIILWHVLPAAVLTGLILWLVQPDLLIIHNPYHWLGLIYVGMIGTAMAWWIYTVSLRHIEASATASFKLAIPLLTTIAAWLWFDERLTGLSVIGMLLIIGGIFLVLNYTQLKLPTRPTKNT